MTDDKTTDDALHALRRLSPGAPSPEAKKLALNAAMVAFDAAQARRPARSGWLGRFGVRGFGAGLGATVAALVLIPVGTQLYVAQSHRMAGPPTVTTSVGGSLRDGEARAPEAEPVAQPKTQAPMETRQAPAVAERLIGMPSPAPRGASGSGAGLADKQAGRAGASAVPFAPPGDRFRAFDENGVKVTAEAPVSTFSVDVDTASYAYVRSLLDAGYLPQPDAVRIEELVNYFPYDYAAPDSADTPFKATMSVIPTPWNAKTELLEIGIKGYTPPPAARQPQHLTFLIDTSGSMDDPQKLPLLKRAFGLLVDNLRPDDTVAIVTYAGSAGVVLEPTPARSRATILSALDRLRAGGATAGADGIALAYQVAAESRTDGSTNRVILATDGDFNVGIDTPEALEAYIRTERDKGIFLSVLGFGHGNLDDATMQALAQNGNGDASYIDSFAEARKVLVSEAGAGFATIAKDVKVQVEFNPAQVSEYRLIGYETRALEREDFNNDAVDAGEIGAGHTVTALYEITPAGSGGELDDPLRYASAPAPAAGANADEIGFLKIRYKTPEGEASRLISAPITSDLVVHRLNDAGTDQRFAAAVAAFGQKLKGSKYGEAMSWQQIDDLASGARGADADGYRAEFVRLVRTAADLMPDSTGAAAPGAEPTLPK